MDEFVLIKIWIRILSVFSRFPEAEFALIGTKSDVLKHSRKRIDMVKTHLLTKLKQYVETHIHDIEDDLASHLSDGENDTQAERDPSTANIIDNAHRWLSIRWENVSFEKLDNKRDTLNGVDRRLGSVQATIEGMISCSGVGYAMPELYTMILDFIVRTQHKLSKEDVGVRVDQMFTSLQEVHMQLKAVQQTLDEDTCRRILQTLRDFGYMLWFEDENVSMLSDKLILDPSILIELIRQLITHHRGSEVISNKLIMDLPYWSSLDPQRLEAMKKRLQHFKLVRPVSSKAGMEWDSDLLVPMYWKSKVPATVRFGGQVLELDSNRMPYQGEQPDRRVRWHYIFVNELPVTLFDDVVIKSYSPFQQREVGPDWILYEVNREFACRLIVDRDKTKHRVFVIEAVSKNASDATDPQAAMSDWELFYNLVTSIEGVLKGYRGIFVSKCAFKSENDDGGHELAQLLSFACATQRKSESWMPPHWERSVSILSS